MSRILITIDTANDAFRDNGWQQEAVYVLAQLAVRLASNRPRDITGFLRDTHGVDCGAWDYIADEPSAP